ncbi:uncharacterized protein [Cherax quadricarinatus]
MPPKKKQKWVPRFQKKLTMKKQAQMKEKLLASLKQQFPVSTGKNHREKENAAATGTEQTDTWPSEKITSRLLKPWVHAKKVTFLPSWTQRSSLFGRSTNSWESSNLPSSITSQNWLHSGPLLGRTSHDWEQSSSFFSRTTHNWDQSYPLSTRSLTFEQYSQYSSQPRDTWGDNSSFSSRPSQSWEDSYPLSGRSQNWDQNDSASGRPSQAWEDSHLMPGRSGQNWEQNNSASGRPSQAWEGSHSVSSRSTQAWDEENLKSNRTATSWEQNDSPNRSTQNWNEDNVKLNRTATSWEQNDLASNRSAQSWEEFDPKLNRQAPTWEQSGSSGRSQNWGQGNSLSGLQPPSWGTNNSRSQNWEQNNSVASRSQNYDQNSSSSSQRTWDQERSVAGEQTQTWPQDNLTNRSMQNWESDNLQANRSGQTWPQNSQQANRSATSWEADRLPGDSSTPLWAQKNQPMARYSQQLTENSQTTDHYTHPEKMMPRSQPPVGYDGFDKKGELSRKPAPLRSHFGMKMLQRMGWMPGEGLGKNKEGMIEPLMPEADMDLPGAYYDGRWVSNAGQKNSKPPRKLRAKDLVGKHPVSALIEVCTNRSWPAPVFEVVSEEGPVHKKTIIMKVTVNGKEYLAKEAASKKLARADAAKLCLQFLGLMPKSKQAK